MKRAIALAFLCALFLGTAQPAHSQIVLPSCGTIPASQGGARTAGNRSDIFVDVNGQLCTNATGGTGGTSSTFGGAFPATGTAAGLSDGTNMQAWLTALALGDGVNGNNTGATAHWLYNGATWDRARGDLTNGAWVNVKTSVLPTGAASAANQATEIASLATIVANTAASIPAGTATIGNVGSATGAAAPASAAYLGANGSGATGGLLAGLKTCDLHAKYDASDNGSKTLVTGVSGRKVYICGYMLATGGTATNLKLVEGSDANCATNGADLTPAWQLVANDKIGAVSAFWTGLAVSTNAYYVCVNASAGNAHQAEIWYTIQ